MDQDMRDTTERALRLLKERFRTYNRAAEELGVTRQAIRDWRLRGAVSYLRVQQVSDITGIPIDELRPDLFRDPGDVSALSSGASAA